MSYVLRPYQEEAIEQLRANIRRGIKNQVICIPTGGGKTLIAAHLINECFTKGKRAVMVADRTVLVDQTSAVLDAHAIPHGVLMSSHWRRRPYERVQIASAQTIARRQWPPADLIVVDECHTQQGTVLRRIAARDTVVIGLSATPTTKALGKHYDAVVTVTTTNKLIAEGHLVPYKIYAASQPDMTGVRVVAGEYDEKQTISRVLPIVGDCVSEYLAKGNHAKWIAFCVNVDHCREVQKRMMDAGIMCELFTYQEGDEQRTQVMEEFRKADSHIRGLISVSALSRGLDVPDVGCVILARPLRSSVAELIQSIGRGLRPAPGKDHCVILDHGGSTVRMWDRLNDIYEDGITQLDDGKPKKKKEAKKPEREPITCSRCAHVHAPRPSCPSCGFVYERKSNISHQAGELVEVAGADSTSSERRDLYAMLLHIAQERNYSPGWAAHKFKERTGRWPNGMAPDPIPPTQQLVNWVRSRMIAFAKSRRSA